MSPDELSDTIARGIIKGGIWLTCIANLITLAVLIVVVVLLNLLNNG